MAVDVASSLTSSLGINTGINTTQLVSDLTSATYQPKIDNVNSRLTTANSRISALASAKSSLQTFSDALTSLLKSSEYSGQPVSNDTSIAAVSLIPGATGHPTGLPAQLEVQQLAQAQVLQSTSLSAATATAGVGTLNLVVDGKTTEITLTDPKTTLADLKDAINAKGAGVTASIVTDSNGARLVLKGETGTTKAFTLAAKTDPDTGTVMADADLQRFTWDGTTGGMTRSQQAQNAKVKIDNVAMEFSSNTVTTAIPNLRIDLNKAAPGTSVTLATDQPTATMEDLVTQIVDAYNSLKGALNTSTRSGDGSTTSSGLLASDNGVRTMVNMLAQLASTQLSATGPYKTLNDIGVKTERTGLLSIDTDRLKKALADDPAAVTQMLNPTASSETSPGIGGALSKISTYLNGDDGPLQSSQKSYEKTRDEFQDQLDKLNEKKADYSASLTKIYSAMQSRLLQYQATKTYLEQQIAQWNNN